MNPNPKKRRVGDCVIRAIALATEHSWEYTFLKLAMHGYETGDILSSNSMWDDYLRSEGFKRYILPDTCPACYTIEQFCKEHPEGTYILATGSHVVAVVDGNYLDTWDSGEEVPLYYYKKEEE